MKYTLKSVAVVGIVAALAALGGCEKKDAVNARGEKDGNPAIKNTADEAKGSIEEAAKESEAAAEQAGQNVKDAANEAGAAAKDAADKAGGH